MKPLFQLAADFQGLLRSRHWRYCFIGGIALQRWGEPRLTRDLDLSLLTGFGQEEAFAAALTAAYQPRIPDAIAFAIQYRVLLLQSPDGIGIDVSLAGLPFEETVIQRASEFDFLPDARLLTCSAEDLMVMKAIANRTKDWADIESILLRQSSDSLDWSYMEQQLRPLCEYKETDGGELLGRLLKLR